MDKETVLSSIYLKAVLPLLEDILERDEEAKKIAGNWNCSIMFHVGGGGPAVTLKFKNGKCEAVRSAVTLPSVALYFPNANTLNRMFAGEKVVPIPWMGFWRLGVITKLDPLTKRIEHYMEASEETLKDEKSFKLIVELMLYAALNGAAQVAAGDEEAAEIMSHSPDGTLEVRILPDGPAATLTKKGNEYTVKKGRAEGPAMAYMELKDFELAYNLFKGNVDAMAALGSCDVRIRGHIPFVDNVNYCLDKVGAYLG